MRVQYVKADNIRGEPEYVPRMLRNHEVRDALTDHLACSGAWGAGLVCLLGLRTAL